MPSRTSLKSCRTGVLAQRHSPRGFGCVMGHCKRQESPPKPTVFEPFDFWQRAQLGATSLVNPTTAEKAKVLYSYDPNHLIGKTSELDSATIAKQGKSFTWEPVPEAEGSSPCKRSQTADWIAHTVSSESYRSSTVCNSASLVVRGAGSTPSRSHRCCQMSSADTVSGTTMRSSTAETGS